MHSWCFCTYSASPSSSGGIRQSAALFPMARCQSACCLLDQLCNKQSCVCLPTTCMLRLPQYLLRFCALATSKVISGWILTRRQRKQSLFELLSLKETINHQYCNMERKLCSFPVLKTIPLLLISICCKKESLFCLMISLEHIDFDIISYWTSNIWLLWHISFEETCCRHIGYSFR